MTTNTVKVISVLQDHEQEKKDGGTYLCTLLTYTDSGKTFNKPFHNKILENNKPLAKALHALQAGDMVNITQVKSESGYWNVTGIEKVDKVTASKAPVAEKPGNVRGSFADNAIGQQVGNALTNAANLMAANSKEVTGMTLLEAARHIILLGEQLKQELASGSIKEVKAEKEVSTNKKAPPKKKAPKVVEPEDDSDIEEVIDEEVDY